MTVKLRNWTPRELRLFFRDSRDIPLTDADRGVLVRFATDDRMRRFWEWLNQANDEQQTNGYELDPIRLFWSAVRGTEELAKPASLPPKKKAGYLSILLTCFVPRRALNIRVPLVPGTARKRRFGETTLYGRGTCIDL